MIPANVDLLASNARKTIHEYRILLKEIDDYKQRIDGFDLTPDQELSEMANIQAQGPPVNVAHNNCKDIFTSEVEL